MVDWTATGTDVGTWRTGTLETSNMDKSTGTEVDEPEGVDRAGSGAVKDEVFGSVSLLNMAMLELTILSEIGLDNIETIMGNDVVVSRAGSPNVVNVSGMALMLFVGAVILTTCVGVGVTADVNTLVSVSGTMLELMLKDELLLIETEVSPGMAKLRSSKGRGILVAGGCVIMDEVKRVDAVMSETGSSSCRKEDCINVSTMLELVIELEPVGSL